MNIILLNKFCKRKGSVELCTTNSISLIGFAILAVIALSASAGYFLAKQQIVV